MSRRDANKAIRAFKRFFFLAGVEGSVVPTEEIDKVWHEFILFTQEYELACHALFGKFIHHKPSTGTPDERTELAFGYDRTKKLLKRYFGGKYAAKYADCCDGSDGCHTCSGQTCCSTNTQYTGNVH
jgi:hypothetical protein